MTRLVSRIYAMGEPPPDTAADREARALEARRTAWRVHGLAVLDPADIDDDWLRAAVRSEAIRRYGQRRSSPLTGP